MILQVNENFTGAKNDFTGKQHISQVNESFTSEKNDFTGKQQILHFRLQVSNSFYRYKTMVLQVNLSFGGIQWCIQRIYRNI